METVSSPLTPTSHQFSPFERSPSTSYHEHLRRRTSSFSSNHSRSPTRSTRRNRFSNASQLSNDFSPDGAFEEGGGGGMGNLADELDQLDQGEEDGEEEEDEATESALEDQHDDQQPSPIDSARDSGIDVSYNTSKQNFSKPFCTTTDKPPDQTEAEAGTETADKLSLELEDALNNIARMTSHTSTTEDPLIPRTISLLQDLGAQTSLETQFHRLITATNSTTAHLTAQSKTLQTLSATLFTPFSTFSLDFDTTIPLIDHPLLSLPLPTPEPLTNLTKLSRETTNLSQLLSSITDTLQMNKHATNAAARHLRATQAMVAELRRERERADEAREELERGVWHRRIGEGWCGRECGEIIGGFEGVCRGLRARIEGGM